MNVGVSPKISSSAEDRFNAVRKPVLVTGHYVGALHYYVLSDPIKMGPHYLPSPPLPMGYSNGLPAPLNQIRNSCMPLIPTHTHAGTWAPHCPYGQSHSHQAHVRTVRSMSPLFPSGQRDRRDTLFAYPSAVCCTLLVIQLLLMCAIIDSWTHIVLATAINEVR